MNPPRTIETRPATGPRAVVHTLAEIAAALDATVVGDGTLPVAEVVHPLMAERETDLGFVMDQATADSLGNGPLRTAVVAESVTLPKGALAGHIPVGNPRYALAVLLDIFDRPVHSTPGIHTSAVVDAGAELGKGVSIGPLAYVGPEARIGRDSVIMAQATVGAGARLGANCLIHPGARIGERVVLGDRVTLQHNASVGADGFSYVTPGQATFEQARHRGRHVSVQNVGIRRINSVGTVILGDDVEIGAGACIDRANLGATVIGRGTKIDNLVTVGHNNRIGEDCLISGQVGISGSCRIGDRVVIAGQAGIADHIRVGDDAVIGAGSGVWRDVGDKEIVAGYPALPKHDAIEREANIGRIRRILRDLADIKNRLRSLERK